MKFILAIICVIIAIYNFDLYNFNRCIVAALLLMQAIMLISHNRKLNRFLRNFSVFLAVFLIFKLLLQG